MCVRKRIPIHFGYPEIFEFGVALTRGYFEGRDPSCDVVAVHVHLDLGTTYERTQCSESDINGDFGWR